MKHRTWIAAAAFAIAIAATAQTPAPTCTAPEYRQFDFWVGEWEVTQNGKVAGRNSIRAILNGCAISEEWSGAGGFKGSSLNFYNADTMHWHQTWIDSRGQSLALEGRLEGESMVLQNTIAANTPRHRITWTPLTDKTVRQVWQVKETADSDWKTLFDGKYSARQ